MNSSFLHKIIFLHLLLTISIKGYGQRQQMEEYDALYEQVYNSIHNQEIREDREQDLLKDAEDYLKIIFPSDQLTQKKNILVQRYKSTGQRWKDDMSIAKHYFVKIVSKDDLEETMKWLSNEEYLLAKKDLEKAISEIQEKEAMRFAQGLMNSLTGQWVPRIKAVKCPESYRSVFKDYYKHSDMKFGLLHIAELIKAELVKESREYQMIVADKMSKYLNSENVENMFLNTCYGKVSEAQLNLLAEQTKSISNQHIMEAIMNHAKDSERVRYMERNYLIGWLLVQDEVYEVRKNAK